ncbi:MAG: hypothetical protein IPO88_05230 [Nannocystis sp.]|nr:hypothetical protein [Nannocystis sp.]
MQRPGKGAGLDEPDALVVVGDELEVEAVRGVWEGGGDLVAEGVDGGAQGGGEQRERAGEGWGESGGEGFVVAGGGAVAAVELEVAELGLGDDGEPGTDDLALDQDLGAGRGGEVGGEPGVAEGVGDVAEGVAHGVAVVAVGDRAAEACAGVLGAVLVEQGGADDDRAGL